MSDIPTKAGIYAILNEITGKLYIGSTVNLRKRERRHFKMLARGCHFNKYLQSSVAKYGLSVFSFHIVELVDDKELLIQREQSYMDETECYDRTKGYNLAPTAGNSFGFQHSDETKARMSEATKGKKHPMWGKHHTDEAKARISEARKGKKFSDEAKARLSEGRKGEKNSMWGKHHTNETKARISETLKKKGKQLSGEKNPFYGNHHSDETKVKISEAQLNWWKQYYAERDKLQLTFL